MTDYDEKKAKEFHKRYGDKNTRKTNPSDSVDMEIWDKDGFSSIKNSKRVITEDPKEVVYEADTHGDITKLEKSVLDETGKKVKIIPRNTVEVE